MTFIKNIINDWKLKWTCILTMRYAPDSMQFLETRSEVKIKVTMAMDDR